MTEKISVGTVGYPIKKSKMVTDVDVVEMTESRQIPPGKKAAKHLLADLPATTACTVQVSRYFATPPKTGVTLKGELSNYGHFQVTDENLSLWQRQVQFAEALGARALVLITPPAITPSSANVSAMARFLETVERGSLPLIWEAHGPWESSQIRQFCNDHQLVPAIDPLRDEVPDFDLAYFRFGAFAATGSRMGVYELEQIAAAALDCPADEVFCVFDTHRALDDARNLKKVLNEFGSDDLADFDYDYTDDDDFDEEE
ncbi:MAG: hypothetical protein JXX14_12270 [Deltaproteobacteria bacterium]|nr:hypothetical protein [Deltaproteobacteria bacterium]